MYDAGRSATANPSDSCSSITTPYYATDDVEDIVYSNCGLN
ncbi:MAG: hypothetical protein WAT91_17870 [Saprospiraceae bacterium]